MKPHFWPRATSAAVLTLAVFGGALGCTHEPPPDPLADDRARLRQIEHEPLPADFPAQARLVLSPQLMADEVQLTLDDAARTVEALRFPVPLLGEVALRPAIRVTSIRAEVEPACADCIALFMDLEGSLSPVTAGGILPGLRFMGTARGVFRLVTNKVEGTTPADSYTEVRAVADAGTDAAGRKGWSANISLQDLPMELSDTVSQSVTGFVQRLMEGEARPDVLLASLPDGGPVHLRGLRPAARAGAVVVDIAFVVIDAGVVADNLPPVDTGFALQLPEQTLLALARAETLRTPPQDGYVVDPQRITIDGNRFALDIAVIKLDRDPTRRDVRVDGSVAIDGTTLAITPERAEQTARSGGFDPFELIVRAAILDKVESALRLAVPVAQSAPVGGRTRQARLTTVVDRGDLIQIEGIVDAPAKR